jgi:hypothetical protein
MIVEELVTRRANDEVPAAVQQERELIRNIAPELSRTHAFILAGGNVSRIRNDGPAAILPFATKAVRERHRRAAPQVGSRLQ